MTVIDTGVLVNEGFIDSRHGMDDTGSQDDMKTIDDIVVLPYVKLGLDARLRDWLDLRCGVHARGEKHERSLEFSLDPDPAVVQSRGQALTNMYLGFGVHWGDFVLDGAMQNTAFLHNGPYFVTGSTTDELAGRLSVTFAFD